MNGFNKENLLASGHRACPGCGAAIGVRQILKATGRDVIVVSATGCVETFTSPYGQSAWEVPWIHSLFENSAPIASGVSAALEVLSKETKVVVISGDGATFDIGFGGLSGMFERNSDVTYICYDNEAYMNTGVQRSGATPYCASTTTTPVGQYSIGKLENKKDMPAIAMAHGIEYVATTSIAYPNDLMKKVTKAINIKGSKYIQIHTPCCIGWGFDPSKTIKIAKLAVETGLVPIFEKEKGKSLVSKRINKKVPVKEYLLSQGRFSHLFKEEEREKIINEIQLLCDKNIEIFNI
ncbi:MAG: pyruvate ferredoxin oxidoreductase [Dethiobacter sp.]|jgi:pyruvate ferredoxin oxidoreductase beta subunit|nr:pyruvate ferredoxin oxidoreductase [Dethiobacter sp.]